MTEKAKEKIDGLFEIRRPFPAHQISKLPKPTKQQTDAVRANFKEGIRCDVCGGWHHPKVVHLDYVGHAALTDRLLDCDREWNWEPVAVNDDGTPRIDGNGGMWIKLTICGVTRLGYGHPDGKKGGDAIKEVIGDALRNAAMRFGAALDLWHKGELHIDEPEEKVAPRGKEQSRRVTSETEDQVWGPDETPFDDTTDDGFEAAVKRALITIKNIDNLDELKGYWDTLYTEQRAVADDKRVINAKDARKADLLRAQRDAK